MNDSPYTSAQVRDLAWACFEPPLVLTPLVATSGQHVANCGLELTPRRQHWLRTLDRQPGILLDHLAKIPSRRLGLYFEALWHFFLQQDEDTDLIAHNLAVREGGITLGEFDCIYYCRQRQQHFHLELAVKYFLANRATANCARKSDWHEWWGPECRDRLDLKLRHLLDHQIRLADKLPGIACLAQLGIDRVDREVEVKGYLFQARHDPLPPPEGYNRDTIAHSWLPVADLQEHCELLGARHFLILPKYRWLSPVMRASDDRPLTSIDLLAELRTHFAENLRARLVAAIDNRGTEQTRFFVVDDGWPREYGQ